MQVTSSTAHLPDGNYIRYTDTGAPLSSKVYTTLVALHGAAFNSRIWERTFALTQKYNLRLIAPQRQAYAGSSPYSSADMREIESGGVGFLSRKCVLWGHFMFHLIQALDLPEYDKHLGYGGIVFLGWSASVVDALTLLSYPKLYQAEQYECLRRYLQRIIFYDPPFEAYGFPTVPQVESSYPKQGVDPREYDELFRPLVASYSDNPSPEEWDGDPQTIASRPSIGRNTTDSWTTEDWNRIFETEVTTNVEWPILHGALDTAKQEMTQHVLFDEATVKRTFPDVPVTHIVCWKSNLRALWAYRSLRLAVEKRKSDGEFVRPINFVIARDKNHFWHWDDPEGFLTLIAQLSQKDEVKARM